MRTKSVQSPVCLGQNVKAVDDMAPLHLVGHWDTGGQATLANDGRSAVVTLLDRPYQPFLVGGPLEGRFLFEQLHFHWGPDDSVGSEHLLDGRTHSMEAHLVHYNARYADFREARKHRDGLAVVAFLLQAHGSVDWTPFNPIVRSLRDVRRPDTATQVPSDCLRWIATQELDRLYYTYRGSLTTAPYPEGVTWIVYRTPVYVSTWQTAAFRRLPVASNFRPVQATSGDVGAVFVRNARTVRARL